MLEILLVRRVERLFPKLFYQIVGDSTRFPLHGKMCVKRETRIKGT